MAGLFLPCLLYTSDAADERSSVDLGGRRIIQKKNNTHTHTRSLSNTQHLRLTTTLITKQVNMQQEIATTYH